MRRVGEDDSRRYYCRVWYGLGTLLAACQAKIGVLVLERDIRGKSARIGKLYFGPVQLELLRWREAEEERRSVVRYL